MKFLLSILPLAFLFAMNSAAADNKEVQGNLVLEKRTIPLKYVYALTYDDKEGVADGPELRILLADKEVPEYLLASPTIFSLKNFSKHTKMSGVMLYTDLTGKNRDGKGTIIDSQDLAQSHTFNDTNLFQELATNKKQISGKIETSVGKVKLSAKFSGPLIELPAIVLSGKQAIESPPAKALIAYSEALSKGDWAVAAKHATVQNMQVLETYKAQVGEKQFIALARQENDPKKLRQVIQQVVIRGKVATVIKNDKSFATFVNENDMWKID